MKKLLLLLLFIPFVLFSQSLKENATIIKENVPKLYNVIKAKAVEQWGDDHNMVLFEINLQADAFMYVSKTVMQRKDFDNLIWAKAITTWSDDPSLIRKLMQDPDNPLLFIYERIDWNMVKFEYDQQMKAKSEY